MRLGILQAFEKRGGWAWYYEQHRDNIGISRRQAEHCSMGETMSMIESSVY
jgi:hypothetical protein